MSSLSVCWSVCVEMCIIHLLVTPHTHTVLMIRHSSVTKKCRRPRPDQSSWTGSDFIVFCCCWSSRDHQQKALIWMYLNHWHDDHTYIRRKCGFKEEKGAQSFPAPSAVASNCFRCGLKCCLFTSFLKHRDRQLGWVLISGPQTQTSSSCHHHYINTGLTAKFQMLMRQARVKLCDSEKQEAGSAGCFEFVSNHTKFQSSYLDTGALMEKDVLARF